jgi:hypothetical protein
MAWEMTREGGLLRSHHKLACGDQDEGHAQTIENHLGALELNTNLATKLGQVQASID